MKAFIGYTGIFLFSLFELATAQNTSKLGELDRQLREISQSGFLYLEMVSQNPNSKEAAEEKLFWDVDFIRTNEGLHYVIETSEGIYFGRPDHELYYSGNAAKGYTLRKEFNSPIQKDLAGLWFNPSFVNEIYASGKFEQKASGNSIS